MVRPSEHARRNDVLEVNKNRDSLASSGVGCPTEQLNGRPAGVPES